ncbi:hypothetical protein BGZ58_011137 [Dissophora ornata]|nr:hypothetical protein BGZ58_011137 [Dissophora ornata]
MAHYYCQKSGNGLEEKLIEIQCNLQDIGSNIATPRHNASESRLKNTTFDDDHVMKLEKWIDELDAQLLPLRSFILPSGGESSIFLHQSRSICRRAERTTIPVVDAEIADESVLKYLNRLSDFLFVAARFAAKHDGMVENVYRKAKSGREASIETRVL